MLNNFSYKGCIFNKETELPTSTTTFSLQFISPPYLIKDTHNIDSSHQPIPTISTSHDTIIPTHVLTLHGKSLHPALWNLSDLIQSNRNLMQVDHRVADSALYKIPNNGKLLDLCGKCLVILP